MALKATLKVNTGTTKRSYISKFTHVDMKRMGRTPTAIVVTIATLCVVTPGTAIAHAFGARYELPLPLWLWLVGAGAIVVLSFVLLGVFLRGGGEAFKEWRVDLMRIPGLRLLASSIFLRLLRAISVGLFLLIIAAGFFGDQTTTKNIAPVLVWVIWWVGLAYVSALCGDLWRIINPWSTLFFLAENLVPRLKKRGLRRFPAKVGAWPAVGLFFIFTWLEIVSDAGEVPADLSIIILGYSAITWAGMARYGREVWLGNAEAFSVCFGLLARFAITEGGDARWRLRPPAVGLIGEQPLSVSMVAFVVLLLAAVSFDGIAETPFWANILGWFAENQALRPLLIAAQELGVDLAKLIKTLGLVAVPLIFLVVYLLFNWRAASADGGSNKLWLVAGALVLTLVPIAIAYHLSHYFSYLMLAGQLAISLASDPFGVGWNLFGTADRAVDISVVSAKMVWYLATVAVVAGHVFAVYLGHMASLRLFASRRDALMSQVPLLLLMVGYSMLSLWILAQPIINL
jgi:hypothetical protein